MLQALLLPGCRRRRLLGSFIGPTLDEQCGACDRCCPNHSLCLVSRNATHEIDAVAAATAAVNWLSTEPPRTLAKTVKLPAERVPAAFRGREAREMLVLLMLVHEAVQLGADGIVRPNHHVGVSPELHYAQAPLPCVQRGRRTQPDATDRELTAGIGALELELERAQCVAARAAQYARKVERTLTEQRALLVLRDRARSDASRAKLSFKT